MVWTSGIREGRDRKSVFKGEKFRLSGSRPKELVDSALHYADKANNEFNEQIETELSKVNEGREDVFSRDELSEAFKKTLTARFIQYTRSNKIKFTELNQEQLDAIYYQALFDFVMVLRIDTREQTKTQSLKLLSLSHWNNPNVIGKLKSKYRNVPESVLSHSALSNTASPEAAVDRYIEAFNRLKTKYHDIPESVLYQSALKSPTNPEAAVDRYNETFNRLKTKYHDIPESVLFEASLYNPTNPEAAVDRHLRKTK